MKEWKKTEQRDNLWVVGLSEYPTRCRNNASKISRVPWTSVNRNQFQRIEIPGDRTSRKPGNSTALPHQRKTKKYRGVYEKVAVKCIGIPYSCYFY